jgi:hypothetical protein
MPRLLIKVNPERDLIIEKERKGDLQEMGIVLSGK